MIVRAERLARRLGEQGRLAGEHGAVADRLEDRAEVADRDALAQQVLQHALHLADAELVRDDVVDGGRVLLLERVEQLLRLLAREQLVGVAADRLGQVRDDDRLGVDDGVAERLGLGARGVVDPHGGQAERGLGRRDAGEARAPRRRGSSPAGGRGSTRSAPPRCRAP